VPPRGQTGTWRLVLCLHEARLARGGSYPRGQTGTWRLVLCLHVARLARGGSCCASTRPDWHVEALFAIHSFVCYQTCEQDILKTNKPILMHIGINGPQEKGMKWSTFGASRSEMKTTRDLTRFGSLVEASFLTPFGSSSFSGFINNLGKCRSCLIIFSVLRSVMDCGRSYHSTTWSQNFCLITSTTVPPGLKTSALSPLPQYHLVSKLVSHHLTEFECSAVRSC